MNKKSVTMSLPRKIEAMLEIKFYGNCERHENQTKKYFCWDCKELIALCEICKECQHSDHNVKQVCKSSRMTAIRVGDAKTMFEISDIQHHISNAWTVIYLYKRSVSVSDNKGNKKRPMVCTAKGKCQECGYDMTKHGFKFCSIQCQNVHEMARDEANLCNKRRRRRKGIPVRSPLF